MSIDGTNFNQISIPQFPTITPQAVQPFGGFGQNNIIGNLASTILGSLLGNIGGSGSLPGMTGISGGFNPSILSMFSGPLAGFFNPIALPSFPQINTQPADNQPAEAEPETTETANTTSSEQYPAEIKPKVEEMKAQLAEKLGVSPDAVKIVDFKDKRSVYSFTLEAQGKTYHGSISKTTGKISIHLKPTENNEPEVAVMYGGFTPDPPAEPSVRYGFFNPGQETRPPDFRDLWHIMCYIIGRFPISDLTSNQVEAREKLTFKYKNILGKIE